MTSSRRRCRSRERAGSSIGVCYNAMGLVRSMGVSPMSVNEWARRPCYVASAAVLRYECATMSSIATAADYADAMMTARKAKNLLFLLLLVMLVTQLALFFVARFTTVVFQDAPMTTTRRVVS